MLEWLEAQLDVGYDKRLMYKYRIEPQNSDRNALKQECRLAHIAGSGTQPPTNLSEKIQGLLPPEFRARLVQKKTLEGDRNTSPSCERGQVLRRQQQNDLRHGGKTKQAY